jgi:hypothetical protein
LYSEINYIHISEFVKRFQLRIKNFYNEIKKMWVVGWSRNIERELVDGRESILAVRQEKRGDL